MLNASEIAINDFERRMALCVLVIFMYSQLIRGSQKGVASINIAVILLIFYWELLSTVIKWPKLFETNDM